MYVIIDTRNLYVKFTRDGQYQVVELTNDIDQAATFDDLDYCNAVYRAISIRLPNVFFEIHPAAGMIKANLP